MCDYAADRAARVAVLLLLLRVRRFCAWVEPDNADVERKVAEAASAAERGVPCVPSTLGEEARHNSFLRCGEPSVAKAAGLGEGADPVAVLAALRQLKDVGAHTKKAVHA